MSVGKKEVVKVGIRLGAGLAVWGALQLPIVAEFVATAIIPLIPEIVGGVEEGGAVLLAYKAANFVGKRLDPHVDRWFGEYANNNVTADPIRPGAPQAIAAPALKK